MHNNILQIICNFYIFALIYLQFKPFCFMDEELLYDFLHVYFSWYQDVKFSCYCNMTRYLNSFALYFVDTV